MKYIALPTFLFVIFSSFSSCLKDKIEPTPKGAIVYWADSTDLYSASPSANIFYNNSSVYYFTGGSAIDQYTSNSALADNKFFWGIDTDNVGTVWCFMYATTFDYYEGDPKIEVAVDENGYIKKILSGQTIDASLVYKKLNDSYSYSDAAYLIPPYQPQSQVCAGNWIPDFTTVSTTQLNNKGYIGLRITNRAGIFYSWMWFAISTTNSSTGFSQFTYNHFIKASVLGVGRWSVPDKPILAGQMQ